MIMADRNEIAGRINELVTQVQTVVMSVPQKADIAIEIEKLYNEYGKENQKAAGKLWGRGKEKVDVKLPVIRSREYAAHVTMIGSRTIDYKKIINGCGCQRLIDLVNSRKMNIKEGVAIAKRLLKREILYKDIILPTDLCIN
jgi:hypothetical protein